VIEEPVGLGSTRDSDPLSQIGFTTSIPIEVLLAAGRRPVDLNNRFITHPQPATLVREAEKRGFPSACCAWMKGIYSVLSAVDVEEVIAVVRGDCSQTQALMEILQMEGLKVYPFAYPYDRSKLAMGQEIQKLMAHYGVEEASVRRTKGRLDSIRRKLTELDLLTWRGNRVRGEENHRFLVSSSDLGGDPEQFEAELDTFLKEAVRRVPFEDEIRLGYLGVPPIWTDLYSTIEGEGVRIVYNEIQRQFSMPGFEGDLVSQYLEFTYPYDIFFRLNDIRDEASRRRLDGFIHYVQAFCFRHMEDRILRHYLGLPILTLEGDMPDPLDAMTKNRIEAFLEVLGRRKSRGGRAGEDRGN
jgi:benzoyl-CoA reductase/2-hydroxyglutaryl-CoA dehydratase subunit BcrC/BadD/HgdB